MITNFMHNDDLKRDGIIILQGCWIVDLLSQAWKQHTIICSNNICSKLEGNNNNTKICSKLKNNNNNTNICNKLEGTTGNQYL